MQYLLTTLETALVDLLSFDLLPKTPSSSIPIPPEDSIPIQEHFRDPTCKLRGEIAQLEEELLPEAIGLTDAFGFTDWELNRYTKVFLLSRIEVADSTGLSVPWAFKMGEFMKPFGRMHSRIL